jgi:hypothetical protein
MGGLSVLWMTTLLAEVHAAVERSIAGVSAAKAANPFLELLVLSGLMMQCLAFHLFLLRTAQHLCLDFATITTRFNLLLA